MDTEVTDQGETKSQSELTNFAQGTKKVKPNEQNTEEAAKDKEISDYFDEGSASESVAKEKSIASDTEKLSKSKKKAFLKDIEKINKAVSELESIVKQLEQKLPPNKLKIVDYIQNINSKRPFASRIQQVIEFYNKY